MSEIADRLHQVLASGDRAGVRYVRRRHVEPELFGEVSDLTYGHIREHAYVNAEGEFVSDVKILQWWGIKGDVTGQ